jgi:hypothetical protein
VVLEAAAAQPQRSMTAGCLSVIRGTARAALAAAQALVRLLPAHHHHHGT